MTKIFEIEKLKNRSRIFKDRFDAGRILGQMLAPVYSNADDVLVLGIPMGGVPIALGVAKTLNAVFDLAIVRKIQIPGNTEAGFGAITEEGDMFLNESLMLQLALSEAQMQQQYTAVRNELDERRRLLRGEHPFPVPEGKKVILVDDGLASGYTMKAAAFMVNKRKALKTILAAPTASRRSVNALKGEAIDEIYCANIREGTSFAVADAYENWHDLSVAEVKSLLVEQGFYRDPE